MPLGSTNHLMIRVRLALCQWHLSFLVAFLPRVHPIHEWPAEVKRASIAIAFHGDESEGKRSKSVLVLSWSAFGVGKKTSHYRMPFAVSWIVLGSMCKCVCVHLMNSGFV